MAEFPAYAILGAGRWAKRIHNILSGEQRRVLMVVGARPLPAESDSTFKARLTATLQAGGTRCAWLCVPPGPHVALLVQAALEADLHVIVEKPWYGSIEDTRRLQTLARKKQRLLAVDFEYLTLEEVENWRKCFYPGAKLRFGGHFFVSRSDRSGIPAIDNLGSHLLAIREYAVPSSTISDLQCSYERPDERLVWIERKGQRLSTIELFTHGQIAIQRFIERAEAALDGAAFPFDLDFAMRVANQINAYKTGVSA
ncbi:MAG TPA: Gfo/Idh/MocA family oxidoreductase [Candidatus Acidoferrum sp.]|nr:Gfo/Idh/MocA family oxidoreductase [Candidatus Acidoferrum sp.]